MCDRAFRPTRRAAVYGAPGTRATSTSQSAVRSHAAAARCLWLKRHQYSTTTDDGHHKVRIAGALSAHRPVARDHWLMFKNLHGCRVSL
jgi:hypothetical protein